ncbi:hypothetical protein VPH35_110263 [Triticum aestivum]
MYEYDGCFHCQLMKCMSHARAAAPWTRQCRRLQSLPPRHPVASKVILFRSQLSSYPPCLIATGSCCVCACRLSIVCVRAPIVFFYWLAVACMIVVAGLVVASYILGRSARFLATSSCCVFGYYWLSYVYVSGHLLCFFAGLLLRA